MKRLLILVVFLAFVTSVFAYTYTCQEGHFQIDVPEGWEAALLQQGYAVLIIKPKEGFNEVMIKWSKTTSRYAAEEFGSPFVLAEAHDKYKADQLGHEKPSNRIISDNYLTNEGVRNMNVDNGFVITFKTPLGATRFAALFIKEDWLFELEAGGDYKVLVNCLNSFRALD